MALCHSQVTLMLCTDINITETTYSCQFQYVLVINKWVIAVKVSNFSGQYLRNHWTLDISVLGYIGIVWPKKHSPEVWSIPPVTPCIYNIYIYIYIYILYVVPHRWPPDAAFYIFIQQIYVLNILNMLHTLRFFLFKMPFIS